jgi:hypothetical protein
LLAHGRWFSPGTPASSKTDRHDIAVILLKVALNTKIQIKSNQIPSFLWVCVAQSLVFFVVFCKSLFTFLSTVFSIDLRLLAIPSSFSCKKTEYKLQAAA